MGLSRRRRSPHRLNEGGQQFLASLGLLMTDTVELSDVAVFAEPHKGTRGGPSDAMTAPAATGGRLVELGHVIRAGMITYPGLPGPQISPHMTREACRLARRPRRRARRH